MKFNVSKRDMRKTGVYCITNKINNKIYIGSTSNNFYNRYHQHVSDYKAGKSGIRILYNAFNKYGIENFEFKVVYICEKDDCLKWEQYYINKGTDYNCAKIAGSLLNYKHPPTAKTKTIIGGLHHSARPIFQFDLDGKLLKRFGSITDAIKHLKASKGNTTHIKECCVGKIFSILGYRWSYSDKLVYRIKKSPGHSPHKVLLQKDNMRIKFVSQSAASKYLKSLGHKANQGNIARAIEMKIKLYKYTVTRIG